MESIIRQDVVFGDVSVVFNRDITEAQYRGKTVNIAEWREIADRLKASNMILIFDVDSNAVIVRRDVLHETR
jgi:hypothetical protein